MRKVEEAARHLVDKLLEGVDPEPEHGYLPQEEVERIVADLVAKGKLQLMGTDPETGAREYDCATEDPFLSATLTVHDPARPDTFELEGVPYALRTERFQDKDHDSPVGGEWEDVRLEDLGAWIDEH